MEDETDGGVWTIKRSSTSNTSGEDPLLAPMFGQRNVPWGLQILNPLFSFCSFAAFSSAAVFSPVDALSFTASAWHLSKAAWFLSFSAQQSVVFEASSTIELNVPI